MWGQEGQGGVFRRSMESRLWDKYSVSKQLSKTFAWFYTGARLYSFCPALMQNGLS